jgi:hypothetical protein
MFSLSLEEKDRHFNLVQEQTQYRWNLLGKDIEIPLYFPGKEELSIIQEFDRLNNLRIQTQSNVLFKASNDILLSGRFRRKSCVTFEHSCTDPFYNCTSLKIGKRRLFALEGPVKDSVPYFLRLLENWRVSYLVCLTDQIDSNGASLCYPYWEGRIAQKEGSPFLRFVMTCELSNDVSYLFWPEWMDSQGTDPRMLIKAVNAVRQAADATDIIAVHCSAGVGRTGTFISAIGLLDLVDEQLANGVSSDRIHLKIGQLFLYLNFHRPWMVATASQYVTLYKTVELYIKEASILHL